MTRRASATALAVASVIAETAATWQRGWGPGGAVVVRCRDGHLFSTIWVPGASVKSLRFAAWRLQRCPVGGHWSVVTPVQRASLTDEQRRGAEQHRDIRVP